MKRAIIAALAALLIAAPASAAVQQKATEFAAFEKSLAPVLLEVREARDAIPTVVLALGRTASSLRLSEVPAAADAAAEAFDELGRVAAAGIVIIDAYEVEPCSADYVAVLRAGFLMLADAAADPSVGGPLFNHAMYLIFVYGERLYSVTEC